MRDILKRSAIERFRISAAKKALSLFLAFLLFMSSGVFDILRIATTYAADPVALGEGTSAITIKKEWSDGDAVHSEDSVTVSLYRVSKTDPSDKTLLLVDGKAEWELSESNDWTLSIDNIEEPEDGYAYTVEETAMSIKIVDTERYGYQPSVSLEIIEPEPPAATGSDWQQANVLTNGRTYVFIANSNVALSYTSAGNVLAGTTVNLSGGNVPSASQWICEGGKLKNVSTGTYLNHINHGAGGPYWEMVSDSAAASSFVFAGGKITPTGCSCNAPLYQGRYTSNDTQYTYTLYEYGEPEATPEEGNTHNITVTNKRYLLNPGESVVFGKKIDNLEDENADTSLRGKDFYRIYLDVMALADTETEESKGVDLLLIVDQSWSMGNNNVPYQGQSIRRDEALRRILDGYNNTEGLIENFLSLDARNQVAVVGFDATRVRDGNYYNGVENSGNYLQAYINGTEVYPYGGYNGLAYSYQLDSEVLQNWTSANVMVDVSANQLTGTNYEAGLLQAVETLKAVKDSGNNKVVIFISDGVPTSYVRNGDDNYGQYPNGFTVNVGDRGGTTMSNNAENVAHCITPSKDAFDDFKASLASEGINVIFHSVGLSDEIGTEADAEVLAYYAQQGGGQLLLAPDSADQLYENLFGLMTTLPQNTPKNVVITDTLSKYVDFYTSNPDVLITMPDPEGNKTTVYSSEYTDTSVIKSVVYDEATKTIMATFQPEYALTADYTYTLSYNVSATEDAYNEYEQGGYGDTTGGESTDYPGNETSSDKAGFYANDDASVNFTIGEDVVEKEYPHPVIQIDPEAIEVGTVIAQKEWYDSQGNKIDPLGDIKLQLYRIGTFSDGITTETLEEKYGEEITVSPNGSEQTYTFADLPATDFVDGRKYEFTYYVVETSRGEYKTTYTGDKNAQNSALKPTENGTIVVTNTLVDPSIGETLVEYNKTIDDLGDGDENEDTDLSGIDYFRIYLDVSTLPETTPQNVVITDTLSKYVDFYTSNPDVIITMTDSEGNKTTVYSANSTNTSVIQSVVYDEETKTITATFQPEYVLAEGYTYSLSYNVKVADTAYDDFYDEAQGGYPDTGDSDTDYGENESSSNNSGFYANEEATLKYTFDEDEYEIPYPHPVVQIDVGFITVDKVWKDPLGNQLSGDKIPIGGIDVQLHQIKTEINNVQGDGGWVPVTQALVPGNRYVIVTGDGRAITRGATADGGYVLAYTGFDATGTVGNEIIFEYTAEGYLKWQGADNLYLYPLSLWSAGNGKFGLYGTASSVTLTPQNAANGSYLISMTGNGITIYLSTAVDVYNNGKDQANATAVTFYEYVVASNSEPLDVTYGDPVILGSANDWSYTFAGLPKTGTELVDGKNVQYEYTYYIEELTTGYTTEIDYGDEEVTAINDGTIIITNTVSGTVELPEAGGRGTRGYLFCGVAIILSGFMYGMFLKCKRRKEVLE